MRIQLNEENINIKILKFNNFITKSMRIMINNIDKLKYVNNFDNAY